MLRRLRSLVPPPSWLSNAFEVVGLSAFGWGAWQMWGQAVGLMVAGGLATLYGVALGEGS